MLKGKTKTGFEYEINQENLDDMEFLELLNEVDTNPLLLPKLAVILLGEDGKKRLYEHVRKDGRVPISAVSDILMDIFNNHKDLKN